MRIFRPGDVVTVHCCAGAYSELPPGLPEGSMVTVLRVDYGYADVQDEDGRCFTVASPQIDMPAANGGLGHFMHDDSSIPLFRFGQHLLADRNRSCVAVE